MRILVAFQQTGYDTLLVDDVFADQHGIFLQLVYVQEEFLVYVLAQADLPVELFYLLRHQLDHVGIQVDTLLQDTHEDDISCRIEFRERENTPLQIGETSQRTFPERHQHPAVRQDERNGLHRILFRSRDQEVRVREYGRIGF